MERAANIRVYKVEDKSTLMDILSLNVPQYFHKNEIEDYFNYLDYEIEDYFVIEFDNQLIGAGGINFANNRTIGKISWDIIHPNQQKKGFGKQLLTHRIEHLKKIDSVELISVRTSQHTYKFYEKNGFKLNNIIKDYWAEGFDLYEMTHVKI